VRSRREAGSGIPRPRSRRGASKPRSPLPAGLRWTIAFPRPPCRAAWAPRTSGEGSAKAGDGPFPRPGRIAAFRPPGALCGPRSRESASRTEQILHPRRGDLRGHRAPPASETQREDGAAIEIERFPRLERFDVDFDLPEAFLPESPPAISLPSRPEIGDVSRDERGDVVSFNNLQRLFKDLLTPSISMAGASCSRLSRRKSSTPPATGRAMRRSDPRGRRPAYKMHPERR
jgi:hypothetical protein